MSYRGARAVLTANLSIPNAADSLIAWQSAAAGDGGRDTDGIWSAGAPTRLTVPPSVSKVQIGLGFRFATAAGGFRTGFMWCNGAPFHGGARLSLPAPSVAEYGGAIWSDVIDVTALDYFELGLFQSRGSALDLLASPYTWAAMNIIEAA